MIENIKNKLVAQYRDRDRETGISLAEVLVYCALFVILSVIVVSVVNTTISSSQRITSSSMTQAKMNQAASLLQRELSISTGVTYATLNRIDFNVRQTNSNMKVSVFSHVPGGATPLPPGVVLSQLPNYNAIMRVTYPSGSNTPSSVNVLVENFDDKLYFDTALNQPKVFSYFDKTNSEMVISSASTTSVRGKINRIEFRIAATADGRSSSLQIESSAVPAFAQPDIVSSDNNVPLLAECVSNFNANITARNQYATLTWNAPAGAVSYTITRTNNRTGAIDGSVLISDPGQTSLSNSGITAGLAWGTSYTYRITVSSAGGVRTDCAQGTATVVPQTVEILNFNPHATDLTTTSPIGSIAMSYPTNGGEASRSETTANLTNGARYTVARGLINQLSWSSRYGTVTYNLYADNSATPFATITNGTTSYQDTGNSRATYGAETVYRVSASNAGGEGFLSNPITLVSPPTAPQLRAPLPDNTMPGNDIVRPDTTVTLRGVSYPVTSTTTVNHLILNRTAENAVSYRTYGYRGNTAATTNCTPGALTYTQSLNFVDTGAVDGTTPWGSYDCYGVSGQNAAGVGPMSTPVSIKQYPGPFTLNGGVSSAQYNFLDLNQPHWGDAKCWSDRRGNANTDYTCFADINNMYGLPGDPTSHGLFDKAADQYTSINISYSRSLNATGGYNISRSIDTNGVKCGDTSKTDLTGCPYQGTPNYNGRYTNDPSVTAVFKYEMPGAAYVYRVAASSAAGMERPKVGNRVYTNPDIPAHGRTWYESIGLDRRLVVSSLNSVRLGNSSYVRVESGRTSDKTSLSYTGEYLQTNWGNSANVSNNNTTQWVCNGGVNWGGGCESPSYNNWRPLNYNARSFTTRWDVSGSQVWSRVIWANGINTKAEHTGYTQWTRATEAWPNYWTGGSAGYWSGSQSRAGEVDYIAGITVPPSPPLVSDGKDKAETCSTKNETDPNFTVECLHGTGIPPAPSGLRITGTTFNPTTKVTTYTIAWNAVPGATKYDWRVNTNTPTNTTGLTGTVAVPAGQTLKVSARTINLNNTGVWSTDLSLASMNLTNSTLKLVSSTNTTANISWTAVPTATSYILWKSLPADGNVPVKVATYNGTTLAANGIAWDKFGGKEVRYWIEAKNAYTASNSNIITVTAALPAPTFSVLKKRTPPGVGVDGTVQAPAGVTPTSYKVQMRWNDTGTWTDVTVTGNSWSGLSFGGTAPYIPYYRAQVIVGQVESEWSASQKPTGY